MKVISISFLVFTICTPSFYCNDNCILVEVEEGLLCGEVMDTVDGQSKINAFRGIPYAAPPVGPLRFLKPRAPKPWNGTRDATKFGAACPQFNPITEIYYPGSEDCLYCNVYTPSLNPDNPIPVMVFFSGFAFTFDAGDLDLYGPDHLVPKGVILVTFNSRNGALGFLSLGSKEVPGNAGLWDQVFLLEWIQFNIGQFGGDPNMVTIFGHSSGAASIGYHLTSPVSDGLFQRAILMSGVPDNDVVYSHRVEQRSFILGRLLGCESDDPEELLAFLQSVPYERFMNIRSEVYAFEELTNVVFKKLSPFVPVVEKDLGHERLVVSPPLRGLDAGNVHYVDIMFSYTSEEMLLVLDHYKSYLLKRYARYPELFVPSKILLYSDRETITELAEQIMDYCFKNRTICHYSMPEFVTCNNFVNMVYDVQRFARRWPQVGNTYFFKFSSYTGRNYYGQKGEHYGIKGAAHGDELNYIFEPRSLNLTLGVEEYNIVQLMTKALTNFAKYGNPTPDTSLGVIWPQYDLCTRAFVEFTDRMEVRYNLDEESVEFLRNIYLNADHNY